MVSVIENVMADFSKVWRTKRTVSVKKSCQYQKALLSRDSRPYDAFDFQQII
jgi:hypothetical protein